jgi:hypothetical protein
MPLDWAMTENNLGNALRVLGERESYEQRFPKPKVTGSSPVGTAMKSKR